MENYNEILLFYNYYTKNTCISYEEYVMYMAASTGWLRINFHLNGIRHRLDGPAVVWADGSREWWVDGVRHRLDGPAIEYLNEHMEWWVNGKRHRLDGPAMEYRCGTKAWYVDNDHCKIGKEYLVAVAAYKAKHGL